MIREGLVGANAEPLFCEYFDLNVRWRADRRALMFEDATLSWRELGERAYRVANGLRQLGLGSGDAIVVLLDNRSETAEIVLGVIRSGACVVPINLTISDEAVSRQIGDCGAVAVLATPDQAARVAAATAQIARGRRIVVGGPMEGWSAYEAWRDGQKSEVPSHAPEPGDPLTVVYSSGTTGVPKGIVHTHLTRTRNMLDIGRTLRLSEDTVWITPLGFYSNASMLPVLSTLLLCGSVVVLRRFDARAFLAAIEQRRVTHFLAVPVMLRTLLAEPTFDAFDLASMELIVVGGAAIEPEVKDVGRARFNCVLLELYGLTEGFITITSSVDGAQRRASVGRPIYGSDMRVLREDGSDAAVGETGEIVGLTQSIMAGYLNRPEETAAVFFDDEHGRRWFRTGDLGKVDGDGFLYYVGRKKDLIVSGGQNIYPVDIEEVGQGHPAVAQIAVVGVPHPRWDETPVAVVVLREGASATATELEVWINERVGRRQKVAAALVVDSMPVNALGKVLKRELRELILTSHPTIALAEAAKAEH